MGTLPPPSKPPIEYKFVVFVCLIFVISCVNASATCNEDCPPSDKPGNLVFAAGHVYTYDLNSDITVYLSGNDAQETTIKLQGQVQLYAESACRYTLRLNRLTVFGPDRATSQLSGGELQLQKPVRFTMVSDELSSEICAEETDTEFSLNLKRAIISMIQSASTKRTETDVFGICPTTFSSTRSGDTLIVTKVRNLNSCGYRESLATGLITGIFDENSAIKTTPVLNGDYSNEQRIKNGIPINIQVNEEYQYLPFSSGDAGARTKVVTKLHLKSKQAGDAPKQQTGRPQSILFKNPKPQPLVNVNNVKDILKQSISNYQNNVGPKAANQFVELIRLMRFTKKDDLLALYQQIKAGTVHAQKELARKIYFDALFRTGSSESIQVIGNLLRNEMTAKEQHLAYLSLNLVKSIDDNALASINKLLDGNPPREAYLSVGNLVSKYCRDHGCESNEIKSISEKFVNKLGDCRADSRKKENNVVAILKGIRNTNNLVSPALERVVQCAGEKYPTRIRVAALQAFAAGACQKKVHNTALNILKNRMEDAELRIEAYLALVACPSGQVANEIKTLLDDETVYQVGSFITSHLANLRSSTDLYRETARQHFANIRSTASKFPADFRRYSFNQEFSYAVNSLGMGASADTTIIYSQKEFLPRSTRFNLTGQLFGNTFNILEVAARQENLDLLLEHYLGPKGVFNTHTAQQLYDSLMGGAGAGKERRSIRDDVNQFAKQINANNEALKDIDYDISLKLFGTEMYFLSLGDDPSFEPSEFVKKFKSCFDKALTDAKGFTQKYENHALFLDADLVYPTSVGLPLKLTLQGASVVRLEASGKINFKKIIDDPKNMKFVLKLVPSYNLDIIGALTVDAYAVSTGIQVSGSVHSSTGAELDFGLLNNGRGVDVNVRLPFKKQEVFSFDHKIVFITQVRGKETVTNNLKFSSKRNEFTACFDQLSRYIGVTFCAEVGVTLPKKPGVALFPLNGGNKINVYLEMDQAYNFKATYNDDQHPILDLYFDTPGSETARATKIQLEVQQKPEPYAKISFDSPHHKASIESGLKNDPKEMVFYANAVNGPDQYHGKIGFSKSGAPPREQYTPIVLFQTPKKTDDNFFGYKVTGNILVDSSKSPTRYNYNNIQIIGPDPEPIAINGWIDLDNSKLITDLKLSKGNQNGALVGSLEYHLYDAIHFDFGLTNNFIEQANGKLKFDIERGDKNGKHAILFVYGKDFASTTKRFEFAQDYSYDVDDKNLIKSLKFNNKVTAPFVPFNVQFDGEYNDKLIQYIIEIGYNKYKLNSNLDAKYNVRSDGDYDINFGASINQHWAKLVAKRDIDTNSGKSKLINKLTASTGTRIELNGVVSNEPSMTDTDINLDGILVIADKSEPYKLTFVLLLTGQDARANGKLLHGGSELITYAATGKSEAGGKRLANVDFSIKNCLTGNGAFHATNGNGNGNLLLDVQKINRKMKINSQFNVAAPVYDMKTDFYYDFERDNAKKISFDTKNKVTQSNFHTDNVLEIQTEKYQLNAQSERDGTIENGKINGKAQLILPSNRKFGMDFERNVNTKDAKVNGNAKIKLTDTMPDQKTRSIGIDSKLSDADLKAKLFQLALALEYINFDGKNVIFDTNFKHLPNGHFKTGAAALTARGNLLSEVVDLLISADEYCPEHAVYRIVTKYGGQLNSNIIGNYHVGGRGKPGTYDITAQINMPNTKIKSIRLQSNAKYLAPQTDDGLYEGQFKVVTSLDDKTLSIDTTAKGNGKHGSGNININLPDIDPVAAEGSYSFDGTDDQDMQTVINLQCKYGKGKLVKVNSDYKHTAGKETMLHATLQTPLDKVKTIDVTYHAIRKDESNGFTVDSLVKIDDKAYGINSNIVITTDNPTIDITLTYPEKTSKFYASSNRLGDQKYKCKLQIENFGDFNLLATCETNFQSTDNFYIIMDADAQKIGINKVHFELNAKQNAASKGVEFKATSQDKNLLNGYADYTIKEEKGKTIIEGEGNVKIYDKQNAASFKFVRTLYDEAKDGEKGVSIVFNGLLGSQNVVLETRITNKVFHIRQTVCEEKNQCINFEVKSLLRQNPPNNYKHELIVALDLRRFGYAYEFGLQSDTEREGFVFSHNFDMHLQAQDKTKYQYRSYIDTKKAGIQLTLPSRTIAIESVYKIPKELFGQYDIGITSYLDKQNKPNSKATIGFLIDLTRPSKNVISSRGEMKFSHPSLRDMKIVGETNFNGDKQTAGGRLELDLFKSTDQAIIVIGKYGNSEAGSPKAFNITSEFSVSSHGLGFEYSLTGHAAASLDRRQVSLAGSLVSPTPDLRIGVYLFGSDNKMEFILTGFNEDLIHADGTFDTNKMNALIKSKIQILGSTPILANVNIQGFTSFIVTITRDNLIKVNGEFSVGKEASLLLIGSGKELFRTRVALDQTHFLASEYKVNDNDIKEFFANAQQEIKKDTERARNDLSERISKTKHSMEKLYDRMKDSIPDFEPIKDEYKKQYEKLIDELLADKTIKEFVDFFNRMYGTIGKTIIEIIKVLVDHTNKILDILKDFYKKLVDAFKDKILPALKETFGRFEKIIPQMYEDAIHLISSIFERIAKSLKAFESDFEKLGKTISDEFKVFAQQFSKYFEIVRKEVYDLYGVLEANIKEMPGFEALKNKYKEIFGNLVVTENIVNILKEITNTLKDVLPTPELDEFVHNLFTYIENKLTDQKVNDFEVLKSLYTSLVKAIKSTIDLVRAQIGQLTADQQFGTTLAPIGPIPFSLAALKRLPQLSSIRFSPWNYFQHESTPSLRQLFYTYRPYAFNPMNFVPPLAKRATIIDGEHMFTFDGKHITFPGNCQYILAQDMANGNFSLLANLMNGKLKSITLMDKGDIVELAADGVVNLNGKTADLPIHKGDMHAWRDYYSFSLLSEYGVGVHCSPDLKICHITVNGYYHDHVRGLLGNGNNEPNDDFLLPNGKLAENSADFGNAYRAQKSCTTTVPHTEHNHVRHESCTKTFNWDSPLRLCYYFVDPSQYREACDHALAAASNSDEAMCDFARAYATACLLEHIPILLPKSCAKCDSKYELGQSYSVVAPQKKADIVIVVDTEIGQLLNEFVQPLIADLRKELRMRDITDAKIAVIGYNDNDKYLKHFTTNGQLDFTGKFTITKSDDDVPKNSQPIKTSNEQLNKYITDVHSYVRSAEKDLGLSPDARAFRKAMAYPFRSSASNVIIAIRPDQLEYSPNPIKLFGAIFSNAVAQIGGINVHVAAPVTDLTLTKDSKNTRNIVGFSEKAVVLLSDHKKRGNLGSSDVRRNLKLNSDMGVDLVLDGDGYVFPLNNYQQLKTPKEKKQFIGTMASTLAEHTARTEVKNECTCSYKAGVVGVGEVCIADEKKLLPVQKKVIPQRG